MLLTSCFRRRADTLEFVLLCCFQEESVDVKALRARFNNKTSTSDASSRDSGSPKSPRPGFGRVTLPGTENDLAYRRVSPTIPPPVMAGPGLMRFPRAEPMASPIPSRPAFFPRPPPHPGVRPSIQPADTNKIKQTGDMLQNMMLGHQRLPGIKPGPALPPLQAPVPAPASAPLPLRQQSRQRSAGDVTPLRRPLPPEGPLPLKPKRPPHVNLEPFMRTCRGPAPPAPRKSDSESLRLIHLQICNFVGLINEGNLDIPGVSVGFFFAYISIWLNVCGRLILFLPRRRLVLFKNN